MGGHIASWEDELFEALDGGPAWLLALYLLHVRGRDRRRDGLAPFSPAGAARDLGLAGAELELAMHRLSESRLVHFDLVNGQARVTPGRAVMKLRTDKAKAAELARYGAGWTNEKEVKHG